MHAFFKHGMYRSDSFKKKQLQIIFIKKAIIFHFWDIQY